MRNSDSRSLDRVVMYLDHLLPDDLVGEVRSQLYAMRIQQRARAQQLAHARHAVWPKLRRHIVPLLRRPEEFDILSSNLLVRREWRAEPESWINISGCSLNEIVDEVRNGLWTCPRK